MKSIWGYLVKAALIPLTSLALATLAACGGSMDHGSTNPPAPGAAFNTADVQFAQMMIPHHQQAVQMADLAATRAADPEIKQLAALIRAAQQPEIDTMTGWLTAWKQPTAQPGGHNMPGMGTAMPRMVSEEDMAALKAASGIDFDRQFTRAMIAHHNGAIQMARDVTKAGSNPDVIKLAIQIEQTQTREVQQLQKILGRL